MQSALLATLCDVADPAKRLAAVAALAQQLGASEALFFVRDPELHVLVPPTGVEQTVAGGPMWRTFLRNCREPGRYAALVDFPLDAPTRPAVAVVGERCALVLFGDAIVEAVLAELVAALPLLGAIFSAEHAARLAKGEAEVARTTGRRAHDLALALDAARGEVEHALDESARLNAELKDDDRRKDEFLAMLGHELRNPMAAIVAALEVMRTEPNDSAGSARARSIIERQTTQLTRLVDDLLDVARVTRGKIQLQLENTDLVAIVRRAVDSTQALVSGRGHELELVAEGAVNARLDRARVEQMVTNLLTNAAKYMEPGGRIRVHVREEAGEAIVRVEDSGIGIDAAMLPSIFDPFVQVTPSIDRGAGGLGIGLTLVRQLATLHGGTVVAQSQPGVGSVFTIRFPAVEKQADAAAPASIRRPLAQKKRVLVVDDNVDSAEMLVALAGTWGHDAQHATDGPSAVAMAAATSPDVVLLDIGLPGMDGYEVAAHLRKGEATRHCRIVAVSGYGHESDREKSRAAGCDDHLVKPVDIGVLRRAIEA